MVEKLLLFDLGAKFQSCQLINISHVKVVVTKLLWQGMGRYVLEPRWLLGFNKMLGMKISRCFRKREKAHIF